MHEIDLILAPNPALSGNQQAALGAEYDMTEGRLVVTMRLSQTFYLMTEHNFDVEPDTFPQVSSSWCSLIAMRWSMPAQRRASYRSMLSSERLVEHGIGDQGVSAILLFGSRAREDNSRGPTPISYSSARPVRLSISQSATSRCSSILGRSWRPTHAMEISSCAYRA